jgi:hypothetical protein
MNLAQTHRGSKRGNNRQGPKIARNETKLVRTLRQNFTTCFNVFPFSAPWRFKVDGLQLQFHEQGFNHWVVIVRFDFVETK